MDKSWKHFIKLGIVHFMAYPYAMAGEGDIESSVRRILLDSDFECIEITHINDEALRLKIAEMARQSGIGMVYGAQPQLLRTKENLNSLDEAFRRQSVAHMKACIDEAVQMEAKGIAFLAGKYEAGKEENHYQSLVKSMLELCRYADEKGGLPVNLEVFDYDVEKCSLIGPTKRALRFAQEMHASCRNFGLMVDLSHMTQLHETIDQCVDPVAPYIRHVHLANSVLKQGEAAYGDQHPRFGMPFSEVDAALTAKLFQKLFDIGYLAEGKRPVVSFEVKPWGDEDPDLVVANAKRFMADAWAKLLPNTERTGEA